MNAQLIVAGVLAILGASVHGVGGEVLVVRKLAPEMLSASPFGGPRTTKAMIHVTWHLTTIAFLSVGVALLLSGSVLNGDVARGVGLVGAATSTGFAAVVVGLGAAEVKSPRSLGSEALGDATNNVAEYMAVRNALRAAADAGATSAHVRMDSPVVFGHLSGASRARAEHLIQLKEEIEAQVARNPGRVTFARIPGSGTELPTSSRRTARGPRRR